MRAKVAGGGGGWVGWPCRVGSGSLAWRPVSLVIHRTTSKAARDSHDLSSQPNIPEYNRCTGWTPLHRALQGITGTPTTTPLNPYSHHIWWCFQMWFWLAKAIYIIGHHCGVGRSCHMGRDGCHHGNIHIKHNMLNQCWFNVDPPSVGQH